MLKYFEVTGFKSFKDKLFIDFSDVRDYKFNEACIKNDLLKNVIVYGKNGIGKSNLGLAIFDIVSHMTNKNVTPNLYDAYINSNTKKKYAHFKYVFEFKGKTINYNYKKDEDQNLIYEALRIDDDELFEYNHIKKSGNTNRLDKLVPSLNWRYVDNDSIVKYVVNNSTINDKDPLNQLMEFVNGMLWFRSLDENRFIGNKVSAKDYQKILENDELLDEFNSLLKKSGVDEKVLMLEEYDGRKKLYFDTLNPLSFFSAASSGTKALYAYFYWIKTSKNITFLFIDEFDSFYHYELSEMIVKMLENEDDYQSILTSHNTNLLTNRIMRPDCYFILTKERLTSLANATKRELREGHNLEKLYISGEFNG